MSGPILTGLTLGDRAEQWRALAFDVPGRGDTFELGGVRISLTGAGDGISGWSLSGLDEPVAIDGLPAAAIAEPGGSPTHPNGAIALDHVVVATPAFDRTAAAFEAAGMPFRRVRDAGGFRQGFRRLGPAIIEVVEAPPPAPAHQRDGGKVPAANASSHARFWGLVPIVTDLEALADRLGPDLLAEPKPAVQPGRLIATLRRAAGLSISVAFMTPEPSTVTDPDADDEPDQGGYPPP